MSSEKDFSTDDFKLSPKHFDALQEIGNIGAGNAVTALSKMFDKRIDMELSNIKVLDFNNVCTFIGGADNIVTAVLTKIHGEKLDGIMMFMMEYKCCHMLINNLLNPGTVPDVIRLENEGLTEMELSAITEVGNILTSSYLNAISELLNKRIGTSVPYLSIDMAGAILSVPAIEFSKVSDKVLFVESNFKLDNIDTSGYFLLVPDLEAFKHIFSLIGMAL